MNLLKCCKVLSLKDAVASGTTDVTDASIIDTAGYEGVLICAKFGTSAADNGIKSVKQGAASNLSDGADLEGSARLLDATDKIAIVDVYRPRERYLRPIFVRATATTLDAAWAVLYGPRKVPVTQSDAQADQLVSPAEGTA